MLSRFATALTAVAALAGGAIATAAPSQAQEFSITFGSGRAPGPYYAPVGGYGYGPPPYAYGPRRYYGPPPWAPAYGYRRCWRQPVDVWTGWGYERRWQRVCR